MDTISPQTSSEISEWVSAEALRLEAKVIAWRRDIHQHPELSYHETRTAALAAKHLSALGYEVTTGVGETGVVGILRGGKPGPVVALRADMDALPVEERVDLPFASKAKAMWHGQMTGVMHACGHDAHVAILMINSTTTPAVLSISTIHGGVRSNILPDDVTMEGTLRVHDEAVLADIKRRITKTATTIADAGGATAEVEIGEGVPVTYNDPALTRWGTRSLGDGVGAERVTESPPVMGAEDFSLLAKVVPGMFFFLGVTPPDEDPHQAPANHSPLFHIHEPALKYGVRALAYLAIDYLRRTRGVGEDPGS